MTEKLRINITKQDQFAFIFTSLLMLITHGFCFTNLMYSHDSLSYSKDGLWKISYGRWMVPVIWNSRFAASPYLMGILAILFVSITVVLVSRLFCVNKKQIIVVSTVFVTNATLASLFLTFVHDADVDCLSILLACFAVYSLARFEGKKRYVLFVISEVLSMALYQTYFCLTVCLLLLLFIYKTKDVSDGADVKKWFREALTSVALIIGSFTLYWVLMKIIAKYSGYELSDEPCSPGRVNGFDINDFLLLPVRSYKTFIDKFINESNNLFVYIINGLIICLVLLFIFKIAEKSNTRAILVLLCVALYPIGIFSFLALSQGLLHQLMIYSMYTTYLIPIVLFNVCRCEGGIEKQVKYSEIAILGMVCIIGWINICIDNNAYEYKKLVYDNTLLHAQTIWYDINAYDGYEEGVTPVMMMGILDESKMNFNCPEGFNLRGIYAISHSAITYDGTDKRFYEYILGRKINIIEDDIYMYINDDYMNMPSYPQEGYIKEINGVLVVKLSEK